MSGIIVAFVIGAIAAIGYLTISCVFGRDFFKGSKSALIWGFFAGLIVVLALLFLMVKTESIVLPAIAIVIYAALMVYAVIRRRKNNDADKEK